MTGCISLPLWVSRWPNCAGGKVALYSKGHITVGSRGDVRSSQASAQFFADRFSDAGMPLRAVRPDPETDRIDAGGGMQVREWAAGVGAERGDRVENEHDSLRDGSNDESTSQRSLVKLITLLGEGHVVPVPGRM